ncbi:MAG: YbjN domain-containing protein [Hyphomicrobiales bacterium]|nr:MAG: YbjN domain-containing protein [Hyphomicrobiales bacterium]
MTHPNGSGSSHGETLRASEVAAQAGAADIRGLTVDGMREALQAAGYRVEVAATGDVPVLRSATGGLAFEVRLANRIADREDFADAAFLASFALQGSLPGDLLNAWNKSRRFARLFVEDADDERKFLVLCMDLSLVGNSNPHALGAQIAIWDSLAQSLVTWLRETLAAASRAGSNDNAAHRAHAQPAASP